MSANLVYRNGIAQMTWDLAFGEPWHRAVPGVDRANLRAAGWTDREIDRLMLGIAGVLGATMAVADKGTSVTIAGVGTAEVPDRAVLWHPDPGVLAASAAAGACDALARFGAGVGARERAGGWDGSEATILPDGSEIVGMVGGKYTCALTIADVALDLLAASDAAGTGLAVDTAGRIGGGRRMWVDLARTLSVGFDASKIRSRVKIADGTDGYPFVIGYDDLRTVCANTFAVDSRMEHRISHTASIGDRQALAIKAIAGAEESSREMIQRMEALARTPCNAGTWKDLRDRFLGILGIDAVDLTTQAKNAIDTTDRLFHGGMAGADMLDSGTLYAAVNALTEYDQWHAIVRPRKGMTASFARGMRKMYGGRAGARAAEALALAETVAAPAPLVMVPA